MVQIFISHSVDDQEFIHELAKHIQLELPEVTVFASTEADAIKSGAWFPIVLENLNKSNILVVVVTPLSEKSIWVAFEYGYFWKQNGPDKIFILRHPKTRLFSPLNELQSKQITHPTELGVFFESLCSSVGQVYQKRGSTNDLAEVANRLSILSSEERRQQDDLIRKMGSRDNVTALNALHELRDLGWLKDGSLRGRVLTGANLNGADFSYSDLRDVKLNWASLREANFTEADLRGADLGGSNLEIPLQGSARAASFWHANLQNTILGSANLRGVNFGGADVRGTDFLGANLHLGHALDTAKFDETTRLPDGQMWNADSNLSKYTSSIL